jgi:hypothetical protein
MVKSNWADDAEAQVMRKLEAAGWSISHLFLGIWGGRRADRDVATEAGSALVRLLDSPRRTPQTPIQQAVVAVLKEAGSSSLAVLVKRVSGELYRDELRKGAAVLDIGLFGDRLFNRDVVEELRAGNGIFWEIKPQREFHS